jgi:hypothetical protein
VQAGYQAQVRLKDSSTERARVFRFQSFVWKRCATIDPHLMDHYQLST